MKKLLSTLACGIVLVSTVNADFLRVEMGAGAWTQSSSGEMTYSKSGATASDKSLENSEAKGYAWLLVKHPVPIVPNLRLEYSSIKNTGKVVGAFKEFSIDIGEYAYTTLEMKQYDIIPYYNILDNTFWTTLDLGIDIKVVDALYSVNGKMIINGIPNTFYEKSDLLPIPLLYTRARVEIPLSGVGLEADAKFLTYNTSYFYDARIKVDYTFNFIPLVQPALEVGYRVEKIKVDEPGTDTLVNLDFSGLYAGVMLRF